MSEPFYSLLTFWPASLASLIYKFCPALPRPLKSVIKVCPSLHDTHQSDRNRLLSRDAVVGACCFLFQPIWQSQLEPSLLISPSLTGSQVTYCASWLPTSFLLLFLLILSAYPASLLFFQTFYTQFLYAPVLISTYPLLGLLFSSDSDSQINQWGFFVVVVFVFFLIF